VAEGDPKKDAHGMSIRELIEMLWDFDLDTEVFVRAGNWGAGRWGAHSVSSTAEDGKTVRMVIEGHPDEQLDRDVP
jgi:hypothetical protein